MWCSTGAEKNGPLFGSQVNVIGNKILFHPLNIGYPVLLLQKGPDGAMDARSHIRIYLVANCHVLYLDRRESYCRGNTPRYNAGKDSVRWLPLNLLLRLLRRRSPAQHNTLLDYLTNTTDLNCNLSMSKQSSE